MASRAVLSLDLKEVCFYTCGALKQHITMFIPMVWFWFVLMVQILELDILKLLPNENIMPD